MQEDGHGRYGGEQIINGPNTLTAGRIIGATIESWKYYQTGEVSHLLKAGAYFSGDMVDGFWARQSDHVTQFGGDLDKAGDKLSGAFIIAGALRHDSADTLVLGAYSFINAANVVATAVGTARGTLPEGVPDMNRRAQLLMNYGLGFNMVGNHLATESKTLAGRCGGQILRLVAGATAVTGASTYGIRSTAQLWKTVLKKS